MRTTATRSNNWKKTAIQLATAVTGFLIPLKAAFGQSCECQPAPYVPQSYGPQSMVPWTGNSGYFSESGFRSDRAVNALRPNQQMPEGWPNEWFAIDSTLTPSRGTQMRAQDTQIGAQNTQMRPGDTQINPQQDLTDTSIRSAAQYRDPFTGQLTAITPQWASAIGSSLNTATVTTPGSRSSTSAGTESISEYSSRIASGPVFETVRMTALQPDRPSGPTMTARR